MSYWASLFLKNTLNIVLRCIPSMEATSKLFCKIFYIENILESPKRPERVENLHSSIPRPGLTASFLVAVVRAVVQVVTDLHHVNAVPVVTAELMRGARGFRGVAQVLLLVRPVSTVVVLVTDKELWDASPVLTGELIVVAGRVGAAPLVTVVTAVITPIAPGWGEAGPCKSIFNQITASSTPPISSPRTIHDLAFDTTSPDAKNCKRNMATALFTHYFLLTCFRLCSSWDS